MASVADKSLEYKAMLKDLVPFGMGCGLLVRFSQVPATECPLTDPSTLLISTPAMSKNLI
jgi:hypothetical protein